MAERVEVIRVGTAPKAVEIARASAEKHSVGTYKSTETDSWRIGITAREYKLTRIDRAAEFSREVARLFEEWCIRNNLTINHGVLGVIRKIARTAARIGEKHVGPLVATLGPYRDFWAQNRDRLISGYKGVRA